MVYAAPFYALTPDGGSVVTASSDGELAWWDLESHEKTRVLEIADGYHSLALSPDGLTAAVGIDGGIQRVDVRSRKVRTEQRGAHGSTASGCFSAPTARRSSRRASTATVTLWDAETADTPRDVARPLGVRRAAGIQPRRRDALHREWRRDGDRMGRQRETSAWATVHVHARSGLRSSV